MDEQPETSDPRSSRLRAHTLALLDQSLCCGERARKIDEVIVEPEEQRIKTKPGQKVDRFDAGWYVFDNLTSEQAEDLLNYHGGDCSYLVVSHSAQEWAFHIRIRDEEGSQFHSHRVLRAEGGYKMEDKTSVHSTLDDVEQQVIALYKVQGLSLAPLFHDDQPEIGDHTADVRMTMTISRCIEPPPEYKTATKYPQAPVRALPAVQPFEEIKPSPLPQSPQPPPTAATQPEETKTECCCSIL